MVNDFLDWLQEEMEKRGWNQADLAREARISPSAVSMVINQGREAGPEFCQAIAKAFQLPDEIVFRRAGLLSPISEIKEREKRILYLFSKLTPMFQERVIEDIQKRIEEQEQWKKAIDKAISELDDTNERKNIKKISDDLLGYVSSPDNDTQH